MPTVTASAPVAERFLSRGGEGETSRPLRICFIIDELAKAGTETQLLALIHRLDRRRFTPYLCLLRGDSPSSRALEPLDCPVQRLGVGGLCRPSGLMKWWRFAAWLRRERIEVVQAYFPDSSYFGLTAARFAGVPHRIRTRNNVGHWLTPLHRRLGRMLNRITTATIANCQAARDSVLATEGPPPDSVVVLENGVDLERFLSVPLIPVKAPAIRHVGVVANLRPVKGLDVLLRAAARLSVTHSRVVFQVAGEGAARSDLEVLAKTLGIRDRFYLPGSMADIPEFLGRLDVVVLPSRAEGMSNALLEYMAAGRPIVATAVGAAPELIEDGVHGLLVPPGDDMALADAIQRLLDDRAFARRLSNEARQRAAERYSRAAMVRRFEEFYQQLG